MTKLITGSSNTVELSADWVHGERVVNEVVVSADRLEVHQVMSKPVMN